MDNKAELKKIKTEIESRQEEKEKYKDILQKAFQKADWFSVSVRTFDLRLLQKCELWSKD